MDNITHSLMGSLFAEGVYQYQNRKENNREKLSRPFWYWLSIISSNLPDLDPIYTGITGGKLGYLLHHRGYTHTLVGAGAQWLILFFIVWVVFRRKKFQNPIPWKAIHFTIGLGLVFHIFMDFWNPYGVHPFWPFVNRWFYGDAVSILEPWFWITLTPFFFWVTKRIWLKTLLVFIFLFGLMVQGTFSEIPLTMMGILFGAGVFLFVYFKKISSQAFKLKSAMGMIALILVTYFGAAHWVRGELTKRQLVLENQKINDVVLFPMPGNPLCWNFVSVESNQKFYEMRVGVYSLAPRFIEALECRKLDAKNLSAEMETQDASGGSQEIYVFGRYRASLDQFRSYYQDHCIFRAAMQFFRTPFWRELKTGLFLGDLRFDREKGEGFAEFEFPLKDFSCPKFVPNWESPRRDLLSKR